jgi:hypothetical protein
MSASRLLLICLFLPSFALSVSVLDADATPEDDGYIDVVWSLDSTASADVVIRAFCRDPNETLQPMPDNGTAADCDNSGGLSACCYGNDTTTCFGDDNNGSLSLGPVKAGITYTCAMYITSMDEVIFEKNFTDVTPLTGMFM